MTTINKINALLTLDEYIDHLSFGVRHGELANVIGVKPHELQHWRDLQNISPVKPPKKLVHLTLSKYDALLIGSNSAEVAKLLSVSEKVLAKWVAWRTVHPYKSLALAKPPVLTLQEKAPAPPEQLWRTTQNMVDDLTPVTLRLVPSDKRRAGVQTLVLACWEVDWAKHFDTPVEKPGTYIKQRILEATAA